MSLPNKIPSHSSSPSKSSLRSASGTQKQPRSLLPSPHFEEHLPAHHTQPRSPPNQLLEYERAIQEENTADEPHRRLPFFTLIEDTINHEYHHPTVHYIFADDDMDILTEAAYRSLRDDDPLSVVPTSEQESQPSVLSPREQEQEESRLPAPVEGVREHYVILDVQPDIRGTSFEVTSAQSLSSEWQVLNTSISNAPTIDATDGDDGVEGLMLKIEGRGLMSESETKPKGRGARKEKDRNKDAMDDLVEQIESGLADIRRLVQAGDDLAGSLSKRALEE